MNAAQDLQSLIDRANNHPMMKQIEQERHNETMVQRLAASEAITQLAINRESEVKKLREDLEAKAAEYKKIRLLLARIEAEYNKAKALLSSTSAHYEREIGEQEDILFASYDNRIDGAIDFFREKLSWLRKDGRIDNQTSGTSKNIFTWTKNALCLTNLPAVLEAISYCQWALQLLEKVKLFPAFDAELLEELKKNIPPIDQYTEYSVETNMKRESFVPRMKTDYEIFCGDRKAAELQDRLTTMYIHERIAESKKAKAKAK